MLEYKDSPNLPIGFREVTKRELALGCLSKPMYRGDYSYERYMEHGEVVSLSLIDYKSDINAEFSINGKPNRRIWLSQLNLVFLDSEKLALHCGEIILKSGQRIGLTPLVSVPEFVDRTKGKQFKVSVNRDWYAIDKWNDKCSVLGTFGAIQEYIRKAFDEERYDDVKGMTQSKPCYSLIEV